MFHVLAVNLTPDLAHASAEIGEGDFGRLDAAQLHAVLEAFRCVDPLQNEEAEPCLRIETRAGKFIVRTARQKLFLYNARDTAEPAAELDADGIVRVLSAREAASTGRDDPETAATETVITRPSRRRGIAVFILLLAAGVNAHTAYVALKSHPAAAAPADLTWLDDSPVTTSLRNAAAGRYTTGNAPGDRVVAIEADGRVRLGRIVPGGERVDHTDTYRVGRRDQQIFLATRQNGTIAIENIDRLHYFGDTYERDH